MLEEVAADFLTNCAFWDMQMRSLARFSDFLGQVPEDYSTDTLEKFPSMISFCNINLKFPTKIKCNFSLKFQISILAKAEVFFSIYGNCPFNSIGTSSLTTKDVFYYRFSYFFVRRIAYTLV